MCKSAIAVTVPIPIAVEVSTPTVEKPVALKLFTTIFGLPDNPVASPVTLPVTGPIKLVDVTTPDILTLSKSVCPSTSMSPPMTKPLDMFTLLFISTAPPNVDTQQAFGTLEPTPSSPAYEISDEQPIARHAVTKYTKLIQCPTGNSNRIDFGNFIPTYMDKETVQRFVDLGKVYLYFYSSLNITYHLLFVF